MIFTPSYVSMMNDVGPEKRGIASGMSTALRQFSASFGLAIFGTLYFMDPITDTWETSFHSNPNTAELLPVQLEGVLLNLQKHSIYHRNSSPSNAHYVLDYPQDLPF